jgi:hypothetical protein
MDRDELARRIRENIFERCSDEGHASKEVIERAIVDSLGKHLVKDSIRDVYTLTEAQPAVVQETYTLRLDQLPSHCNCPTVRQIKVQQAWWGPYRGMGPLVFKWSDER